MAEKGLVKNPAEIAKRSRQKGRRRGDLSPTGSLDQATGLSTTHEAVNSKVWICLSTCGMAETKEAESIEWDNLCFQLGPEVAVGGSLGGPPDDERRSNYLAVSNVYGYTVFVVPKGSPAPREDREPPFSLLR